MGIEFKNLSGDCYEVNFCMYCTHLKRIFACIFYQRYTKQNLDIEGISDIKGSTRFPVTKER